MAGVLKTTARVLQTHNNIVVRNNIARLICGHIHKNIQKWFLIHISKYKMNPLSHKFEDRGLY